MVDFCFKSVRYDTILAQLFIIADKRIEVLDEQVAKMKQLTRRIYEQWVRSLLGAVVFYTVIPLPSRWQLDWQRVARWAPLIGVLLGAVLALVEMALQALGMPSLTRSVLVVALWVALTGGLHLDGAIDTADGLAVSDPRRRLTVMKESTIGAFGAIAAGVLLLLKTAALSELGSGRGVALMAAAGWGRWAQVMAIALYPYLKREGKGEFHKSAIRLPQDVLLGLFGLLGFNLGAGYLFVQSWSLVLGMTLSGGAIACLTGAWFNHRFGGHTGDTYGAVVEWTEALFLALLTIFL